MPHPDYICHVAHEIPKRAHFLGRCHAPITGQHHRSLRIGRLGCLDSRRGPTRGGVCAEPLQAQSQPGAQRAQPAPVFRQSDHAGAFPRSRLRGAARPHRGRAKRGGECRPGGGAQRVCAPQRAGRFFQSYRLFGPAPRVSLEGGAADRLGLRILQHSSLLAGAGGLERGLGAGPKRNQRAGQGHRRPRGRGVGLYVCAVGPDG